MRRCLTVVTLALLVCCGPLAASVELRLQDGRVIGGREVRRDGDDYVLTLEAGDRIVLPGALVEGVRMAGSEEPRRPDRSGLTVAEPRRVAGKPAPEGPTGIREGEPRTLAGVPVRPPRTADQLRVFGKPARFQRSIVDSTWRPSSDWDMDPRRRNNFAPSRWAEDIVDSDWTPRSAFDEDANVLAAGRSRFAESIVGSGWSPTDGFRTSKR